MVGVPRDPKANTGGDFNPFEAIGNFFAPPAQAAVDADAPTPAAVGPATVAPDLTSALPSQKQLGLFLNVYDNMRAQVDAEEAQNKELIANGQEDYIDTAFSKRMAAFRANSQYAKYMDPLSKSLGRPDLMDNIPATPDDEDAVQGGSDIYTQIENGDDGQYLEIMKLTQAPLSPTLSKAQLDSYMDGTTGIVTDAATPGVKDTTVDVGSNVMVADSRHIDIVTQSASASGLTPEQKTAMIKVAIDDQETARTNLTNLNATVIPSSSEMAAFDIFRAMDDTNDAVITAASGVDPVTQVAGPAPVTVNIPFANIPSEIQVMDNTHEDVTVLPMLTVTQQAPEPTTTDVAETAPVAAVSAPDAEPDDAPVLQEAPSTTFDYEIKHGDNPWNIAKNYYGLTNDADIMKAVTAIANANGLEAGTMANHIFPGTEEKPNFLKLPDSPIPDATAKALDWKALDEETKRNQGLRSTFAPAAEGRDTAAAPVPMPRPASLEVAHATP